MRLALFSHTHKTVKSQETSNMKLRDGNYVRCGTRFSQTITHRMKNNTA